MQFEWDEEKADLNLAKHGVSFAEAITVFGDPMALTGFDPDHSYHEDRFLTLGQSVTGRLLIVSHTDRAGVLRIINARRVTNRERKDYEDGGFP